MNPYTPQTFYPPGATQLPAGSSTSAPPWVDPRLHETAPTGEAPPQVAPRLQEPAPAYAPSSKSAPTGNAPAAGVPVAPGELSAAGELIAPRGIPAAGEPTAPGAEGRSGVFGWRTLLVALVAIVCVGVVAALATPGEGALPSEVAQGAFTALATIAGAVSLRSGLGQLGRGWSGS